MTRSACRKTSATLLAIALLVACRASHERPATPKRAAQVAGRSDDDADDELPSRNAYAGSDACRNCHEQKYDRWSQDWHARALSPAEDRYVVGDFANAHYRGASSEAWMQRRGDDYVMRTRGADGKVAPYAVKWLVGGKRMQDTLTEFPDGRLQVLPVYFHVTGRGAWVDYNEKKQGVITESHPFYWTNFRRTANHECLECHTTGLDVRYSRATHHWSTQFADAGVACESCHGPAARHAETKAKSDVVHPGHIDAQRALDICASCHGPREPIFPRFDRAHRFHPGDRYAEKFQPLVIVDGAERSGEYFADGRPNSSSFEYQALLQSQCFLRGNATCLSCHTAPHAAHGYDDLKQAQSDVADAGCRTCHANVFAQASQHSHHKSATCVDCHMPKVLSGVLDAFADHAIDVPNPIVTQQHGVPNACATCHEQKSPQELQSAIVQWWPNASQRQARRIRLADAIDEKTSATSFNALRAVIYDGREAGTLRGACALLLAQRFRGQTSMVLMSLLSDADPLVRARFIQALGNAHAVDAAEPIAHHLDDSALQVRQMAAMVLASFNDERGVRALQKLANDPETATLVRPHLMLAARDVRRGELDAAAVELQKALDVAPYIPDALVMLADVEIRKGRADAARADLEEALRFDPRNEGAQKRLSMMND